VSLYVADAVAMLRYLVDALPSNADTVFGRAEQGIDVVRAPDVQLAEVVYQVTRGSVVAGVKLRGTPREALRGLVANGPIDVAPIGEHELTVYASLADSYSMPDGLLVAAHRALDTDGVVSNDRALASADVRTIWD